MKRTIFITILFSMVCGTVFSQTGKKLSESERQIFEQKMVEQSQKITTLQCTFVQEKTSTLVSGKATAKGILLYQSPSMLRWEYSEPTVSTLILNGNNAILLNKNGQKTGNEKMLKQLGGIIISMINGDGIVKNMQFTAEFYELDNTQTLIVLFPLQKRLKDFYNKIEIKIETKTMLANSVIFYEKSGDKMVISFANKVLNAEIAQSKFSF